MGGRNGLCMINVDGETYEHILAANWQENVEPKPEAALHYVPYTENSTICYMGSRPGHGTYCYPSMKTLHFHIY